MSAPRARARARCAPRYGTGATRLRSPRAPRSISGSAPAARRAAPAARRDGPSDAGARAPDASGGRSDDLVELVERRRTGPRAAEQVAEERRIRPRVALVSGVRSELEHGVDLRRRQL